MMLFKINLTVISLGFQKQELPLCMLPGNVFIQEKPLSFLKGFL
jgi:hypothetical protein